MHFEILVEDISGKKTLDLLIPKIIDINNCKNTFNIKAYSGSSKLQKQGQQAIGKEKCIWAETITPHIDINQNASPSFQYFRDKLKKLSDS